jgi:hypothetical protein
MCVYVHQYVSLYLAFALFSVFLDPSPAGLSVLEAVDYFEGVGGVFRSVMYLHLSRA